jgi:dUTPase
MPVHKFITEPGREIQLLQPDSIHWLPQKVKHNPIRQSGGLRWEIFAQSTITIQPKGTHMTELGFGVRMTGEGLCLLSLSKDLKQKQCCLQDGSVTFDVDDIIVTIENKSDSLVTINEGQSLCYIIFCKLT